MKRLFKHFVLPITAALVFLSLLFSCSVDERDKSDKSEKQEEDQGNAENNDHGGEPIYSIKDHFQVGEQDVPLHSLSTLRIKEVVEGSFNHKDGNATVIIRCNVIEDYYKLLSKDTEVYVPIRFSVTEDDSAEEKVRELIKEDSVIFTYLLPDMISDHGFKDKKGETVWFYDKLFSKSVYLSDYKLIPVEDGRLDVSSVDELLEKSFTVSRMTRGEIKGFDDYFYDGMTEVELKTNAEKLYSEQVAE